MMHFIDVELNYSSDQEDLQSANCKPKTMQALDMTRARCAD